MRNDEGRKNRRKNRKWINEVLCPVLALSGWDYLGTFTRPSCERRRGVWLSPWPGYSHPDITQHRNNDGSRKTMNELTEDALIFTITAIIILILICVVWQHCSLNHKIRHQSIFVSIKQPARLTKYRNNHIITIRQPLVVSPVVSPPSPEPVYANTSEIDLLEPSAPLYSPTTEPPSSTAVISPHSDISTKEEEENLVESKDQAKETATEEKIKVLEVTCEILKDKVVKLERELKRLK